jgi:hypothetical protein
MKKPRICAVFLCPIAGKALGLALLICGWLG